MNRRVENKRQHRFMKIYIQLWAVEERKIFCGNRWVKGTSWSWVLDLAQGCDTYHSNSSPTAYTIFGTYLATFKVFPWRQPDLILIKWGWVSRAKIYFWIINIYVREEGQNDVILRYLWGLTSPRMISERREKFFPYFRLLLYYIYIVYVWERASHKTMVRRFLRR